MMTRRQAYLHLAAIIVLYSLLGVLYSVMLPLHKAPDEIAHFQYSRFIAQTKRLPLNYEEREQAGYKAYQPPLYHGLVAILTGWSDNDGPPYLKFVWESPRFDMVHSLLDTKRLANTEDELFPYAGGVLMWHLGRLITLIIGCGVIITTFFTALELFPADYRLAIWSAALIAFVPTFIFFSSVMNYETMVALFVGLFFLLLIKIVKGKHHWWNFGKLGLLMGLGVMAKYAAIVLPLEVIVVFTYLAWSKKWPWLDWGKRILLTALAAIVVSSVWFLFLMINFNQIAEFGPVVGLLKPIIAGGGDTTQNYIAYNLTGGEIGKIQTFDIVQESFLNWLTQTFQTFWVRPIGNAFPLSPLAHILIGFVCILALLGLIRIWHYQAKKRIWLALLMLHFSIFVILPLTRFIVQGRLAQTAQGRHILFGVATILPVLIIYGWQIWFSIKAQRYLITIIVGGLVCWSLVQFIQINAYYKSVYLPVRTVFDIRQVSHLVEKTFADHIQLIGYNEQVQPEQNALKLSLYWQSFAYSEEDYLRQIKLVGDDVHLVWSSYSVNGRYPTRIWEVGETIRDDLVLPLTDLLPGTYQIQLQLYGQAGPLLVDGRDTLVLGNIDVPNTDSLESTLSISISENERKIVSGATLWQSDSYRKLDLPEYYPRMTIPLVWQGDVSDQDRVQWLLIDSKDNVYPAQKILAHFDYFAVGLDWISGDYRLRGELWRGDNVVTSQEIGPVLTIVNENPRLIQPPPMMYALNENFANRMKLLGYDLPERSIQQGSGVPVALYWQGLRTMDKSYTIFAKILDQEYEVWGSIDRLPADGYPTFYWLEDEVVIDVFELPVDPGVPDGVYWLNVGLYEEVNGSAVSLPLVTDGQPSEVTSVTFGPIKIGGPLPGVVITDPLIEHSTGVNFGDTIVLRGYDSPELFDNKLKLKLFWESLSQAAEDYTVFIHIQNNTGNVVAQMDRPPTNNIYPTSLWSPGEIISDEVTIPLPDELPSGNYKIIVGLYDFDTNLRLSVVGSNADRFVLDELVLQ